MPHDDPSPAPPPELLALCERHKAATTELFQRLRDADANHSTDSLALLLEYQTLLAKHVEELRWYQTCEGMPEHIAELEALLAQMRDVYVPSSLSAAERDLQEFSNRLANRQGTRLPDFDALYRKKTELDRKFLSRPDVPPRDSPSAGDT